MINANPLTHALLSVSDKTGIVEFALELSKRKITLLSTGGTAALLKQNQIPVIDIADFTGFEELMDGRVKTLHPKIYAGILARDFDEQVLKNHDFPRIGLVVVTLYPFEKTIARDESTFEDAIENIDIGGPTLLRAAAKNFALTTVIVDQKDYSTVLKEIDEQQNTRLETRFQLAKKVFSHVAKYDAAISNYFSSIDSHNQKNQVPFPSSLTLQFEKKIALRYGENPHQQAAFYSIENNEPTAAIGCATQQHGKPLSYNNINDADSALECVLQFSQPACVIVKHANPCAVALANNLQSAYEKAYSADSTSAFGGIIAFNQKLDADTLAKIIANQFVEVIIAPGVSAQALEIAEQKPNLRILTTTCAKTSLTSHLEFKSVNGGLLVQERDNLPSPLKLDSVTQRQATETEMADLLFAWQVVRFVKSNAIVYAKDNMTIGIGAGQMSRVFSAKIAKEKAEEAGFSLIGSCLASDAFFPFRDSIDQAAAAGISAIIQPGGSMRDEEVIAAANEYNIAMVFTHQRHFRH
jgi:phosphoribosylaminoimidazolecarboxamide formyltransferase/IMP cyclohydrolase